MAARDEVDICNSYTRPRVITVSCIWSSTGKQVFFWFEEPEGFPVEEIRHALKSWFGWTDQPPEGGLTDEDRAGHSGILGMPLHGPFDTEAEAKADSLRITVKGGAPSQC
jgi:hypothetical protein